MPCRLLLPLAFVLSLCGVALAASSQTSENCTGHGVPIHEERSLSGVMYCSCFDCWTGSSCQELKANCSIDASTAVVSLSLQWFQAHATEVSIDISALYHQGPYVVDEVLPQGPIHVPPDIGQELDAVIRNLHFSAGNAETSGYSIVIGAGAEQLLAAAIYARARSHPIRDHFHAHARLPCYPTFQMHAGLDAKVTWSASGPLSAEDVIEFVTLPNNPDSQLYLPDYPNARLIYDLVYFWPSLMPQLEMKNESLMIFSLSKLTGYAATRFGWALVRDMEVAKLMAEYMSVTVGGGPGIESQLRAAKVLQAVSRSLGTQQDFFKFMASRLQQRWERLQHVFATQVEPSFSLANNIPGNVFAWIECLPSVLTKYGSCHLAFTSVGILASDGETFAPSFGKRFARLCIGQHEPTFEILIARLGVLLRPDAAGTVDLYT